MDVVYTPAKDYNGRPFWKSNREGLITYSAPQEFNLTRFINGIYETGIHWEQERRGENCRPGTARLDVTIDEPPGQPPRAAAHICSFADSGRWDGEIVLDDPRDLPRFVDSLGEHFCRHGAEETSLFLEKSKIAREAKLFAKREIENEFKVEILRSRQEWHVKICTNEGLSLLFSLAHFGDDHSELEALRLLIDDMTGKGANQYGWGLARDSQQRNALRQLTGSANRFFVETPENDSGLIDQLLKDSGVDLRREPGSGFGIERSSDCERALRGLQGISSASFFVPGRNFCEVSSLELGVSSDLEGYFKIGNHLGAEGMFYFSSAAQMLNSTKRRYKWLEKCLREFAEDPMALPSELQKRCEVHGSSLPDLDSGNSRKAYRRVGDIAQIIDENRFPCVLPLLSLFVHQYGESFGLRLVERPELEVDVNVGGKGVETLRIGFPQLTLWQCLTNTPRELRFQMRPDRGYPDLELLQGLAALENVRDPFSFKASDTCRYLQKYAVLI